MEARVFGFALAPPTSPSLFERADVAAIVEDTRGDVRDLKAVSDVLAKSRPEIVLHLAAQSVLRESDSDPIGTVSTNVMGTLNVLEAVRQHNIRSKALDAGDLVSSLVIVTSDKCYENREWVWGYRENEPMGGHDPYSTSKGCAELLTTSYNRSFAEPAAASARAGNVIGGGDWAKDRLISDAIRAFAAAKISRFETRRRYVPGSMFWNRFRDICCWRNGFMKGAAFSRKPGISVPALTASKLWRAWSKG